MAWPSKATLEPLAGLPLLAAPSGLQHLLRALFKARSSSPLKAQNLDLPPGCSNMSSQFQQQDRVLLPFALLNQLQAGKR